MARVPDIGDPFTEEDFFMYLGLMHDLRKKQPTLTPGEIMWFCLQNVGEPFTILYCEDCGWRGYKKDIELPKEGPPVCPEGHRLDAGPSRRLGWIPDGVAVDERSFDEEACTVYYDVDFGQGPVPVRCTEVGHHKKHQTQTFFR